MLRSRSIPAAARQMFVFTGLALGAISANAATGDAPDNTEAPIAQTKPGSPTEKLKEIVVTGSRLPTAESQTALDVHIYTLERIEQSGQSTVNDFLATLPEVSLLSPENANLATQVRLRGTIFGSALILINGHRTQPTTGGAATLGFFDLSTIPLSLVERIEVLPNGSSAIYGGDALAGVVNIVLRSEFTGAEAGVGYKWAKNTDSWQTWAGGGWKSGGLSLTIMGTYSDQTPLFAKDRAISASPDLRPFGGPNMGNRFFGVPGNVFSVSGNLPGLNSSFAAVPVGSTGIGLKPSDFAATAGTLNLGNFTSYSSLVPDKHDSGVFLGANYTFGASLEVFAELLASKYRLNSVNFPPFLQLATVPASNPFNPFGTAVRVSGVVLGAEDLAPTSFDEQFVRPLVGARGEIGTWEWEATALYAKDRGTQVAGGRPNTAALNAALASSDPQTALNPFVDGPMASPAVLAGIYSTPTITNFEADSTIVDAFARGPVVQLPAGPLTAVVGAEYQKNSLSHGFEASQRDRAVFAEIRAPVLAGSNERGETRELLTLQGAVRDDDYSDFGSKTTWQAAFELRPLDDLLLRGTHATAFKPPTLYNLAAPIMSQTTTVSDPQRNGETVVVQAFAGGNAALQPTTGKTSTLGFVWSPREVRGLNLSLTRWWMQIDDAINLPSPAQFIVDNETIFPGRVIRAPAPPGSIGQIIAVDQTYLNFGTMHESGFDGSIDWRFRTALGDFTPAIAATYLTRFDGATTGGSPPVDRLSRANNDEIFAPRWKALASIAWDTARGANVWLDGRYIGSYYDYPGPASSRKIGNVWYLDASVDVDVERALVRAKGSLAGMKLLVSVTNLADKLPVWSNFFRGYDVLNYDIVGRTFFVRLKFQS